MIEVRFHGRGGQGAVTAANILANAAFKEGKDVQAFPYFGVERRGAPVTAFTRIDKKPIRIKSEIYTPDYVVVLDSTLLETVNVFQGLKENGGILINTGRDVSALVKGIKGKVSVVDATSIAIKHGLGSKSAPIINTAILGAFAKATEEVSLDSILESIKEYVPAKKDENVNAAKEAYESVTFQHL